jgi:hypothetical protein
MPIYKLIGYKWTVSQKLVQSIDDQAPLLKVYPLISRKLGIPSMKNFRMCACDGTTPVRIIDPEKTLKEQDVPGMACLYVAEADNIPSTVTDLGSSSSGGAGASPPADDGSSSAEAPPPPPPADEDDGAKKKAEEEAAAKKKADEEAAAKKKA